MKKFAIWREGKVIGYCEMKKATADKLNKIQFGVYFGFDNKTNPEKYEGEE